jgi:hypothetical protein
MRSETLAKPSPPATLPFVVRPSRKKELLGLLVMTVFLSVVSFFRDIFSGGLTVVFLLICGLVTLVKVLDQTPRLILGVEGLQWRMSRFSDLRRVSWTDIRAVRYRYDLRHHDAGWLVLTLAAKDAAGGHEVEIRISGLNVWGPDLPDLIRGCAPHLPPALEED